MRDDEETRDSFYHGRIRILQRRKGFRFSVDAPLLADFITARHGEDGLELGTGSGVISLLLSLRPFRHVTAVEIQRPLAELARRNVILNSLEDRITVVCADLRQFRPGRKFDFIFSNPPYHRRQGGHPSASEEKTIAKHETKCDISDIMLATSKLLKRRGSAFFIFPEKRRLELMAAARQNGLRLRSIRFVHPRPDRPASLFLSRWDFSAAEETRFPPLTLSDAEGMSTAEAEAIFAGRTHAAIDS